MVVLTEFAFVTKRKFNIVIDFRCYTGTKFHSETVKCFTFNRISRAISQSYDRINIIVHQVIGCGNSDFRLNIHTIFKFPKFTNLCSDDTGQDVTIIARYFLVGRILISVLFDMDITQTCFRCYPKAVDVHIITGHCL